MKPYTSIIILLSLFAACKSANDYVQEGHEMGLKGNYHAAITLYCKAIQKDPKSKEAYLQRGLCYEYLQQDSLAINDYQKLLSIDHQNTMAYYSIGLCRFKQNKFEEAIDNYNKALITKGVANPLDTEHTQVFVNLNKSGLLAEMAAFDVASSEIFYERGLAYYSCGQIRNSFRDFRTCIDDGFNSGESYYMLGLCWLTANKQDKACEAFKKGAFYGDSLSKEQLLKCR